MRPRTTRALAAVAPFVLLVVGAELAFRASPTRDALRDARRHTAIPHRFESDLELDPEIVYLGDSRPMYGVDPEAVSRVVEAWTGRPLRGFNLALPGAPPVAQLALADRIAARERRPRIAVVHVSPYMFSTANEASRVREPLTTVYTVPAALRALLAGMPLEDALTAAAHAASDLLRHRRALVAALVRGEPMPEAEPLSRSGVASMPDVPAEARRRAAEARARSFTPLLARPAARFDARQLRYLEAAVRRLERVGVSVVVVVSPEATSLARIDGPRTIVPEFRARIARLARALGVPFHDHRRTHPVRDFEFADGDHATRAGARRYSAVLARDVLVPMSGGPRVAGGRFVPPRAHEGCALVEDFEGERLHTWRLEGSAFRVGLASGASGEQPPVRGFLGVQLLGSYDPELGDAARGRATSPAFVLDRPELRLRVGGGRDARVAVELRVAARAETAEPAERFTTVRSAHGDGSGSLHEVRWNVAEHLGRTATLVVLDGSTAPGGHVLVDHIERCTPRAGDGAPLGGS